MSLDERGLKILRLLVDDPTMSGVSLEKEVNLSRKQISYSLEKINFYLKDHGFEEISRLKTGRFIISREVIDSFKTNTHIYDEHKYVFIEQERLYLIALILLQRKEELSIHHFTSMLKVSKNTVLVDLKKLQSTIFRELNLKLWYDRQNGYYLVGKEYEKRVLMIKVVQYILPMLTGEFMMLSTLGIDEQLLSTLKKDVEEVEHTLKVRYTDERIKEIPFILYFILVRIRHHKLLDVLPEDYQHIVGTSEYGVIIRIFDKYGIHETMEKVYIVSQFQMSSVNFTDENNKQFEDELHRAAQEVLHNFENLICIQFQDQKSLLDALIQHCRPALYRIRYHYHIESNILNMILPHHTYLFELTKHAMAPFENMLGKAFPDEELAYITILFGGWLTKEGTLSILEQKRKAIVVCTNGISISNFLFLKLKEAFPEIEFLRALSSRQFYEQQQEYDVVFTTVHLDTAAPQFLVKPIMDEYDIQNLRRKVFDELLNKTLYEINSTTLFTLIEKYTDIKDRKGLSIALKNYFGETAEEGMRKDKQEMQEKCDLIDLLTEDQVTLYKKPITWEHALRLASQPLLKSGCIGPRYIDAMIQLVNQDRPIWTIARGLVLAHAGVDEAVNFLGVSLLKLDEPVSFCGYMEATVIVVMATPNREIHLKALYDLIDLVENEQDYQALKNAETKRQVIDIIKKERTLSTC